MIRAPSADTCGDGGDGGDDFGPSWLDSPQSLPAPATPAHLPLWQWLVGRVLPARDTITWAGYGGQIVVLATCRTARVDAELRRCWEPVILIDPRSGRAWLPTATGHDSLRDAVQATPAILSALRAAGDPGERLEEVIDLLREIPGCPL